MIHTIARPLLNAIAVAAIDDAEWLGELAVDVSEGDDGVPGHGTVIILYDRRTGRTVSHLSLLDAAFIRDAVTQREEFAEAGCPLHNERRRRYDIRPCSCAKLFRSHLKAALLIATRNTVQAAQ